MKLGQPLANRLRQLQVDVQVADRDTVVLRHVPTNARFFNKPRTNVLVKKLRAGMPFLVCVDEDLDYIGIDAALSRAFAGGHTREGWRTLFFEQGAQCSVRTALERTLDALGSNGGDPILAAKCDDDNSDAKAGLLAAFTIDLSQQARDGKVQLTVDRENEIEDVASCVLRWGETRLPVVVGESGVGKTNLLHAVARKLVERRPELTLVTIDLSSLFAGTLFDAERENLLATLLKELSESPDTILAAEHLGLALWEVAHGPLLLAQSMDGGARLIGTTLPAYLSRFKLAPLGRRLQLVELTEPSAAETADIVVALRERIAAYHHLEIDQGIVQATVAASQSLDGHFPAKAIALLDAAAARAALAGTDVVGLDDIYFAASRRREVHAQDQE